MFPEEGMPCYLVSQPGCAVSLRNQQGEGKMQPHVVSIWRFDQDINIKTGALCGDGYSLPSQRHSATDTLPLDHGDDTSFRMTETKVQEEGGVREAIHDSACLQPQH